MIIFVQNYIDIYTEPEEDYGGELDGYDGGEPYGDEDDDGPPWDEEDDDGEEAGK